MKQWKQECETEVYRVLLLTYKVRSVFARRCSIVAVNTAVNKGVHNLVNKFWLPR